MGSVLSSLVCQLGDQVRVLSFSGNFFDDFTRRVGQQFFQLIDPGES
jgi:hypothetical protein